MTVDWTFAEYKVIHTCSVGGHDACVLMNCR